MTNSSPSPRVWFITGASSGFGKCMTELVLRKGGIVVATLRKPEALGYLQAKYPKGRLLVLKLDVAKPEEVAAAFTQAHAAFGRVDVVFNNAGYTVLGEVESVPDNIARSMFEVNFWGAVHVAQQAVKVFRDVNNPAGGRLLNVSSILGISGLPALGFFCASKHALEGISEALAAELDPEWNIKVSLIELGGYRTKSGTTNLVKTEQHPAYSKPTLLPSVVRVTNCTKKGHNGPQDPEKGSLKIYELSLLPNPPLRLALGKDAIAAIKPKLMSVIVEVGKYQDWSQDLQYDFDD